MKNWSLMQQVSWVDGKDVYRFTPTNDGGRELLAVLGYELHDGVLVLNEEDGKELVRALDKIRCDIQM